MLYLAHALLPASTRHALKCHFVQPNVLSLVLGKHSQIEVYAIQPQGLKLLHQSKVFDVIEHINSYKKLSDSTATLLVLTTDLNLFTLRFCPKSATIITTASISLHQIGARPADYIQTSIIDPHGRCVILHALNGFLHVIPLIPGCLSKSKHLDPVLSKRKKTTFSSSLSTQPQNLHPDHHAPDGELYRSFQLRLNEVNVHALNFAPLSPNHPPTLLIVYSNHLGDRVLRGRKIDLQAGNCEEEVLRSYNCRDPVTGLIIPVSMTPRAEDPYPTIAGAILIGEESAELVRFAPPQAASATNSKGKTRAPSSTASQRRQPTDQSVMPGGKIKLPLGAYTCFCKIDDVPSSWLLGDIYGNLILLSLKQSTAGREPSLSYHHIGHVPSPEALVYIPHRYVFLASHYGDSQLLKLPSVDHGPHLENPASDQPQVITTFSNLAPISDFCVIEDRKSLVNQIVTCSGAYRDGSLRVIKHGIGIRDFGSFEVGGVQRLWALRSPTEAQAFEDFDDRLILSCADSTRFLALNEVGSMEELDQFNGFDADVPTVLAGNLLDGIHSPLRYSIQVTSSKVIAGPGLVWELDKAHIITSAALRNSTCVLSLKRQVVVLRIKNATFVEEGSCELLNDISSLAIDPCEKIIAAGTWVTNCIEIISISTSTCIGRVDTASEFMVNSLMMTSFEQSEYDGCRLLIGLGDGNMMNVSLGPNGMITDENTPEITTLGVRPIEFVSMRNATKAFVWVNSDSPSIISRAKPNGRFTHTPVAVQGGSVTSATGLHSRVFPNSVVLALNNEIRIGELNPSGKMNAVKVSLGAEQPRRIAHSQDMKAYGVICVRLELDQKSGILQRIGSFKIFDDETFRLLYSLKFFNMEQGSSVAAIKLGSDMVEHFVIGTGIIKSSETEAKTGRILAVRDMGLNGDDCMNQRHFRLTNVGRLSGSVGGLGALPYGMFVASANAFVHVFAMKDAPLTEKSRPGSVVPAPNHPWTEAIVEEAQEAEINDGFKLLDTWGGGFVSQTVVTDGTKVLVGDLYKSVVLLEFDLEHLELTVKARDFSAMSVRPIGTLSKREFIAADSEFNLFTVQYRNDPTTPQPHSQPDRAYDDKDGEPHHDEEDDLDDNEDDSNFEDEDQDDGQVNNTYTAPTGLFTGDVLTQVGAFHLGENVNHFRRGSLVPRCIEASLIGRTKLIFVTSTGGIGVVAKIHSKKKINQLARLQATLSQSSMSIGNLHHSAYRMFKTRSRKQESTGFLDGDFLERCLELSWADMEKLVKKMAALKTGSQAADDDDDGDGGDESKPNPAGHDNQQPLVSSPHSASLLSDHLQFSQVCDYLAQLQRLH